MARRDRNAEVLLDALLSHLRSSFDLSERTCYETLEPFPDQIDIRPGGPIIITVAMGNGEFGGEYQRGGGIHQVTESLSWAINLYCPINLDPKGRDPKGLRQVIGYKRDLLRSLASMDFVDSGGQNFLRDQLLIRSATLPEYLKTSQCARITVVVEASFDWDLESSSSSSGSVSTSSTSSSSSSPSSNSSSSSSSTSSESSSSSSSSQSDDSSSSSSSDSSSSPSSNSSSSSSESSST